MCSILRNLLSAARNQHTVLYKKKSITLILGLAYYAFALFSASALSLILRIKITVIFEFVPIITADPICPLMPLSSFASPHKSRKRINFKLFSMELDYKTSTFFHLEFSRFPCETTQGSQMI